MRQTGVGLPSLPAPAPSAVPGIAARIGCAKGEFMAFPSMTGLAVLLAIAGTVLASCADISHKIVDTIPEWAGGMPKNVPPRPGTPEYDAWMEQQQAEAARDKSKDPPKPKTEAEPKIGGDSLDR